MSMEDTGQSYSISKIKWQIIVTVIHNGNWNTKKFTWQISLSYVKITDQLSFKKFDP